MQFLKLRRLGCQNYLKLVLSTAVTLCMFSSSVGRSPASGNQLLVGSDLPRAARVRGGGGFSSQAPPLTCDCRKNKRAPPRDARIIKGRPAGVGEFPWQARIEEFGRFGAKTWNHICGGALISPDHVITAAHCLGKDLDKYRIILGSHNRHTSTLGKIYRVKEYVQHRGSSGSVEHENDIALITIEDEFGGGASCDQQVQPICVDSPEFSPGTACYVSGWGQTEFAKISDRLQYAAVPLQSFETCQRVYNVPLSIHDGNNYLRSISNIRYKARVTPNMICAGPLHGGTDVCLGDSGGPLACFDDHNVAHLTGIISWAGALCGVQPSVYTRVSQYKQWIREEQDLSRTRSSRKMHL